MTSADPDDGAMNETLALIRKNRDAVMSVADLLYGDGAWEISKALTDEQKRKVNEVAVRVNQVGAVAGPAAMYSAYRSRAQGGIPRDMARGSGAKLSNSKRPYLRKVGGKIERVVSRLDKPGSSPGYRRAAAAAGVGLVGLQAVNWGGDALSAKLLKEKRVSKGFIRNIRNVAQNAEKASSSAEQAASDVSEITGKLTKLANKKTAVAAVGGTAATLGGAQYAGSYYGTKRGTKAGAKLVAKAAPPVDDYVWRGEISKMDTDKRQVFGWASIIEMNGEPVVDLQGDIMTIETIEKAAYDYVKNSRKGGNQHQRDGAGPLHVSDMIESFLVTDEKKQQMGLPDGTPTGWWVGFQINDEDTWAQVKSGKRKEFSIHGSGVRKEVSL